MFPHLFANVGQFAKIYCTSALTKTRTEARVRIHKKTGRQLQRPEVALLAVRLIWGGRV